MAITRIPAARDGTTTSKRQHNLNSKNASNMWHVAVKGPQVAEVFLLRVAVKACRDLARTVTV